MFSQCTIQKAKKAAIERLSPRDVTMKFWATLSLVQLSQGTTIIADKRSRETSVRRCLILSLNRITWMEISQD